MRFLMRTFSSASDEPRMDLSERIMPAVGAGDVFGDRGAAE